VTRTASARGYVRSTCFTIGAVVEVNPRMAGPGTRPTRRPAAHGPRRGAVGQEADRLEQSLWADRGSKPEGRKALSRGNYEQAVALVAQLKPLSHVEALELLPARRRAEPDKFGRRGRARRSATRAASTRARRLVGNHIALPFPQTRRLTLPLSLRAVPVILSSGVSAPLPYGEIRPGPLSRLQNEVRRSASSPHHRDAWVGMT
jgi:hypothetical protein